MNRFFCMCFLFVLLTSLSAKNVIYIVVEGVGRTTFYSLIKQGKLPNYNKIIKRGNFRNLGMANSELSNSNSTFLLYNGYEHNTYSETSFFSYVKKNKPSFSFKMIMTSPVRADYNDLIKGSLVDNILNSNSPELIYRTSNQIAQESVSYISSVEQPFFLMLNFTNVDYVGKRYREGADLYSKAIKNTDRSIGAIINILNERNMFQNTEFLITTNYGYHAKLQLPIAESWIVSTQKTLRKGRLQDIYPSLVDLLDINQNKGVFSVEGTTLF